MAITIVNIETSEEQGLASLRAAIVNFKGDSSYTTGGTVGVAAKLGFAPEKLLCLIPLSHGGYIWDYDPGTDKLKMYQQSAATGALTEVPNTTNLSGTVYRALALGG